MKVGVIGLGKIGVCMASVYAKHGFDVVGIDTNGETVSQIQRKLCPIEASEEKGLADLLQVVPLKVSTDYNILKGCHIVIIIVPTPSISDGRFSNAYIISALESLCKALALEKSKPVVVIKSTVMPGSCEGEFIPLLKGSGISLCYSAEMVGLGDVISGLEYPEELLIGGQNKEAGDKLQEFYQQLFIGRAMPALKRMSLWNAELAKLALNVFLVNKISLANTVARLCDQTPTGNVNDVLDFVGTDSRIGGKFLSTGLGFGGPCFPRDSRAFISLEGDVNLDIPKAIDKVNQAQIDYIYNTIKPLPQIVSVLGVTYKPQIQFLYDSMVLLLLTKMIQEGVDIRIHDPKGLTEAKKILGDKVYYATSIEDCLKGSELAILGTAWDCYKNMDIELIKHNMEKPVVYDCWRIWDSEQMRMIGIDYHAFGIYG